MSIAGIISIIIFLMGFGSIVFIATLSKSSDIVEVNNEFFKDLENKEKV